ncbi:AI-2E family transporter [Pelagovum pacificum]|uniref:AI-2E family transporter n=2 Tax=Pelagovum pacificum TaxID=2588711 RepID=A0A5C5GEG8_9RHOB|nr:AI-2E family transporter [Pelagovum pacificum]QQA43752.1 AI-2E family transporter [Pelagovum pacificum]TNY33118.1 AI-2E family transporter [Pelagovum pacificum]
MADDINGTQYDERTKELRAIRRLIGAMFIIALFGTLYFARALLFPIVLGLLIALTLRPVARSFSRIGIPLIVSGVSLIAAFSVLVGGAIYFASGPVGRLVSRAPEIGQDLQFKLRHLLQSVDDVQEASEQVENMTTGGDGVQQVVLEQGGLLSNVVGSLASAGTSLAVATVLAMFFLASGDFFQQRVVEVSRRLQDKKRALIIVRDVERQISRYLAAITIINAGLGVCIWLALWLIGLPNAHFWGIAAFLLNFLPFIGAMIGVVGVAMVSVVTFDSIGYAALCPAAYLALTALEGNVVTPSLLGRHLAINVTAVFLTVTLWVWLWGIAGAFLAVPVLVILKVLCDHVPAMNSFGLFLGSGESKRG